LKIKDGRDASHILALEIGCGVGWHPIQYVLENPNVLMIAIERTREKYEKFVRRLVLHKDVDQRLAAVHSDAIHFLDQNLPNHCLDEVWLLYPNPELKHPKKRWFQSPFFPRLLQLTKPTAQIYFATNIESYAADCLEWAPRLGLAIIRYETIQKNLHPNFQPRTHFEKKYLERGETIHNFVLGHEPLNL
ncbi:MAG: hypothetical protein RBT63_09600, partial [Bdellovibrionales bacterium]|nr:hypothetical protein [Bdellovibrionales bacterium]